MRANSSVFHNVAGMCQPQSWACWYTSLQMVVGHYRQLNRPGIRLIDPSEDPETSRIYGRNEGIGATPGERERIARKLGFTVGYISLTADGMWALLRNGPVIYAGRWPGQLSGHWVVITGISQETITVNDPAAGPLTWNYNEFAGRYLLQTAERPLIYVQT
jgi:ABC-type bacteriocin/lantibiotic exporter with double-glycine peptidase domain